jgi:hypothetical protein
VLNAIANLKLRLEQYDIDIRYYGHKLQAGIQSMKYNTSLLRFLAED